MCVQFNSNKGQLPLLVFQVMPFSFLFLHVLNFVFLDIYISLTIMTWFSCLSDCFHLPFDDSIPFLHGTGLKCQSDWAKYITSISPTYYLLYTLSGKKLEVIDKYAT